MRSAGVVTALVIGAATVFAACTDVDRLPTAGRVSAPAGVRLLGVQLATPVERASSLGAPVSWSFTVGPEGGVSRNDEVGLTIVVPPGALQSTETITVSALAGASVAYRFEPHLSFSKEVSLIQDLAGMRSGLLLFSGAHFEGDAPQVTNGKVVINEIVPAVTSLLDGTVTIRVNHFSGWLPTSGNENPPTETSGTS